MQILDSNSVLDPAEPQGNDSSSSPATVSVVNWTLGVALLCSIGILLWNAARLNFIDDEVGSYYLNIKPIGYLLHVMSKGSYEDAPFDNILMHFWTAWVGRRILLLRLPGIILWLATLPGIFLFSKKILGSTGAKISLILLVLNPYTWTFPATNEWYPLFTFLLIWNFEFFWDSYLSPSIKLKISSYLLFITSSILMCYTNYFAPVVLAMQLLLLLLSYRSSSLVTVGRFLTAMGLIGIFFSPWIHVLLEHLPTSIHRPSSIYILLDAYNLVAGEFASPYSCFNSIAVFSILIVFCYTVVTRYEFVWKPAIILTFLFIVMSSTGVINPKRLLFLTPFLAMVLAGTFVEQKSATPALNWIRILLISAYAILIVGSITNFFNPTEWTSYRWSDPFKDVVRSETQKYPSSLVMTDSDSVLFYLNDSSLTGSLSDDLTSRPKKSVPFFDVPPTENASWANAVQKHPEVMLIYPNSMVPISTVWDCCITGKMKKLGYIIIGVDKFSRVNEKFMKFRPLFFERKLIDLDYYRIIVIHYRLEEDGNKGG